MKNLVIAIAGCGTAGLAAAIYLARSGHQVHLFERSAALKPLGAGLLLQPTGLAVLRELGLFDLVDSCGQRVDRLYGQTPAGRRVMDMRYRDLDSACFGLGIQRGALFQTLLDALPESVSVRLSATLTSVDNQSGTLTEASGAKFGPYDLVVIADGAHSALRASFAHVCSQDRAYPWGAVWCLVKAKDARFDAVLTQRYRTAKAMCGLLPVGHLPDETRSADKLCVYWSLPTHKFADWELHGLGNWRSHVHELWPDAADLLAQIQHPDQTAKATYRDVVHKRWFDGRAVLLGDSAHAMSPQLGQGANMALLDARALCQAIDAHHDLASALAAYDQVRREHVGIYQFVSRWLTPLFQSDSATAALLRDWCMYPVGRVPGIKGQTLKVLAGVQKGLFGRLGL